MEICLVVSRCPIICLLRPAMDQLPLPRSIAGLSKQMIGHRLTTKQTPKDGVLDNKVQ